MSVQTPSRIHFFSWHTKVSLELPVGFEEASESPEVNAAMYADDLDEDDPLGGRVLVRASAVPDGDETAWQRLADESAGLPGRETVWRRDLEVDGLDVRMQLLRYAQDDIDVEVVRLEAFAQAADVVFSITGLAPADRQDEYVPGYEHAVTTARFVLL
ncbi:MAG: hypothetical protein KG028_10885 [Actinobacteria bacterium]|jgi:hypothetical protein|nr:hypothetical protein [Actinomycetota bacterium]